MPTREIHAANGTYAGYARFSASGAFQGTFGGYGSGNSRNGASRVQNAIRRASANAVNRERNGGGGRRFATANYRRR